MFKSADNLSIQKVIKKDNLRLITRHNYDPLTMPPSLAIAKAHRVN